MEGHVDRLRAGLLDGWAWNSAQPNDPVCIEVWNAENRLIAVGVADQYRADLDLAGKGNGAHGFSIRLPEDALSTACLSVCILGESIQLVGSPLVINNVISTPAGVAPSIFDPYLHIEDMKRLDRAYSTALIETTKLLTERRQKTAYEILGLNTSNPGIINTIFNIGSRHQVRKKRDVIFFPPIDWDYRYQRPQQLACGLADLGHRVFYISPTFLNEKSCVAGSVYDVPNNNVFLIKLKCNLPHPEINRNRFTEGQLSEISKSLHSVILDLGISSPACVFQNPVWSELSVECENTQIIYDCLDLISGFEATSAEMLIIENRLIKEADVLIASSPQLVEYLESCNADCKPILVRNGTSETFFNVDLPIPNCLHPTIGYLGAIELWFDATLIKEISELKPNWRIVLAGHPHPSILDVLENIPNVIFLGEISAAKAASVISTFDVATIPFLSDGMTRFVNPVKVYEYLAAGRGVVACKMPELDQFDGFVHQASDSKEFCEMIDLVLKTNSEEEASARRMRVINENWNLRSLQISNIISLSKRN